MDEEAGPRTAAYRHDQEAHGAESGGPTSPKAAHDKLSLERVATHFKEKKPSENMLP